MAFQLEAREKAEERREMLLTELIGELVKVRGLGYKTMRRARVKATPRWNTRNRGEEFVPLFDYEGDSRQQSVETIKRLDVMTSEGWATVWDDGTDDLYGGKLSSSAKPTGKKYKAGML
jgi:hypothetical protein